MINREDMLELTRRMTVARSNFTRIAGAYYDEEGYVEGTFDDTDEFSLWVLLLKM